MAASAAVDELGQLCQTMKDAVTHGNAPKPVVGFAGYCDKRADQMRARIAAIQQRGSVQQAQMMTVTAQRTLKVAKGIAAQIPQPDSKPAAHP
jgi:hypothetical protein